MAYSIVETVTGFNANVQRQFYTGSKTAVLKPAEKLFQPEFGSIKVREVALTGGAANYDKNKGYDGAGGNVSVKWVTYTADNDRYIHLNADAMDEYASYLQGTKPSILLGFEQIINMGLASEVDAVAMSRAHACSVEAGNTVETSTLKTGFFAGLIDIGNKLFEKGVDSEKTVFMWARSDVYAQGEKEILEKHGLANGAVLKKADIELNTGIDGQEPLKISTNIIKFNNFVIFKMPKDRMSTEVTLLDGRTEGQEAGGFQAGSTYMSAVVIPEGAFFVDVRYLITNILFPAYVFEDNTQAEIDEAIKKIVGDVRIENIGINQKSNNYEINARVIYDAHAFEINADKILCFTEA